MERLAAAPPPPQPACVTRLTTSDPGRLLLTAYPAAGGPGDIQHMDIPNLRGISRTAPYFMNNSAATLEEVLTHYTAFFKRVQVQNPAAPLLTTSRASSLRSSIGRLPMPKFQHCSLIYASSDRRST